MFVRLSLLSLAALLLGACDGDPLRTVSRQACCCDRCPTTAAPAAPPAVPAKVAATPARPVVRARRATSRAVREVAVSRYERTGESGYGGRYGARGAAYVGTSVSFQETESATARYGYSESSSGYAYGSVAGGGGYACPDGCRDPRYAGGYHGARTDRDGYLTWPDKVED